MIATMRSLILAVLILLVSVSVAGANDSPASTTRLPLPEDRDALVSLPDLALPPADPARDGDGLVSLADLRGEKYILHVFASW